MLYPAQLYAEELKRRLISCWYDEKYQYYFGNERFAHQVPDNTEYRHEFVHLNSNGDVDGYFSYSYDKGSKSMANFGLISFSDFSADFTTDVLKRIRYMFAVEGCQRLDFWCFEDNPVRKTYEKLINRFGGTLCGKLHRASYFGGKYHDTCFYEVLRENMPQKYINNSEV